MFFTPRKPKTTVFTVFFAPGSKNHGIYSVVWPAPSKNGGIYAVFSMLQEVLFPCQKHKNTVNYSVFAFETRWKTSENNQQVSKMELLFQAHKTEVRHGIFGALPSQALASPSQTGPNQSLPPHTP